MLLIAPGCAKNRPPQSLPHACADRFPTPAPTEEPEATDPNETDEADYYFDFGQDDMIRLNYAVSYPESEMAAAGWTAAENTRVSALLDAAKSGGTITVAAGGRAGMRRSFRICRSGGAAGRIFL